MDLYEIWKITEYKNYEVSNRGRVRNKNTKRILKPFLNHDGYLQVRVTDNGKVYTRRVHRLVAIAFIENPLNKETVNHKDGNKVNNDVNNLEWNTIKENVYHSINVLGVNPANGLEKTHEKHKRKVVRSDGKIYNSIDEAKADIKKPNAHIVEVCQGKLNKTAGYGWSYL